MTSHDPTDYTRQRRFSRVETLMKTLRASTLQALQIRAIIKNYLDLTAEHSGPHCFRYQSVMAQRKGLPGWEHSFAYYQILACNEVLELHGLERIYLGELDRLRGRPDVRYNGIFYPQVLLYCNTGETYQPTILYDIYKDRFLIGSWGDWVEKNIIY